MYPFLLLPSSPPSSPTALPPSLQVPQDLHLGLPDALLCAHAAPLLGARPGHCPGARGLLCTGHVDDLRALLGRLHQRQERSHGVAAPLQGRHPRDVDVLRALVDRAGLRQGEGGGGEEGDVLRALANRVANQVPSQVGAYWLIDHVFKSEDQKNIENFARNHSLEYLPPAHVAASGAPPLPCPTAAPATTPSACSSCSSLSAGHTAAVAPVGAESIAIEEEEEAVAGPTPHHAMAAELTLGRRLPNGTDLAAVALAAAEAHHAGGGTSRRDLASPRR